MGELHIGEQLGLVYGEDSINTFEFDHYRIFNDHVHAITAIELYAFVLDREWDLALETQALQL